MKGDFGKFAFADDLLKHHVRTTGWLPACKRRLATLRSRNRQQQRRLRYFTFCAPEAMDVLMLDVAKVVRPSKRGFDTVFFFNLSDEQLARTRRSIPGAQGFVGDFFDTVLFDEAVFGEDVPAWGTTFPVDEPQSASTRAKQRLVKTHYDFRRAFPFDVLNLDVERYVFRPKEPPPGKVINALRRVFRWQHDTLVHAGKTRTVDEFTLFFTMRAGPDKLGDDYLEMLDRVMQQNVTSNAGLAGKLTQRFGHAEVGTLRRDDFESFLSLATPKMMVSAAMDEDWAIDPTSGVVAFEFERSGGATPYRMLHFIMDLKRQEPRRDRRAPGEMPASATEAYESVFEDYFGRDRAIVTSESVNRDELMKSLKRIESRRQKIWDG